MEAMSLMEIGVYTVEDLHAFREQRDDLTIQLIEGEIVMSPSPGFRHQAVQAELIRLLFAVVPAHLRIITAPMDLRAGERTVIQPDVMVMERALSFESEVTIPPILAVEILSPSSRSTDLVRKPEVLGKFGCEHYWVIDPLHPAIRVFRLAEGAYLSDVVVEGDDLFSAAEPFQVGFRPVDLTR